MAQLPEVLRRLKSKGKLKRAAERRRGPEPARDARVFGYTTANGRRVIDPLQAEVVRRIYRAYAAGDGFQRIAKALERDRVPSPRGKPRWSNTQVGVILSNHAYRGQRVLDEAKRAHRGGTTRAERLPEVARTGVDESLRIVDDELWRTVRERSAHMTDVTWRRPSGKPLIRPATAPWLLTPFLACGVCGGPMTARKKGRGTPVAVYFCTRRNQKGAKGCRNARGLKVEQADATVLQRFDEALAAHAITTALQEAVEERNRRAADPAPLHRERARLERKVANVARAIAVGGDHVELLGLMAKAKARMAQIDEMLAGRAAVDGLDLAEIFYERVWERALPLLESWRTQLWKDFSTAHRALQRIMPRYRLRATPNPDGSWSFEGPTNYDAVLKEAGFGAALEELKRAGIIADYARIGQESASSSESE